MKLGVEGGMTLAGVGLAATVAVLAYGQIVRNDGVPKINGVEHMALFAQPTRVRTERVAPPGPAPAREEARAPERAPEVDYTPTASIPDGGLSYGDLRAAPPRYRVRRVLKDRAIFEGPDGEVTLRRGESMPGVGRVQAILFEGGRWVALMIPDDKPRQSSR